MKITVVQPAYNSGSSPDEEISKFIIKQMESVEKNEMIVFPEYSNAGGLSDKEKELAAMPRAKEMLTAASEISKEKQAYISINVLEKRDGEIKNSTYLFNRQGEVAFIYDKIHLPPSEIKMGIKRGNGCCVCTVDGIKLGFLTCYDGYFNEQIEYIAGYKPDIILFPGYQRGERADIIRAQAKLISFRCNSFTARSSYSMNDEGRGGCSMIVAPDGEIIKDIGNGVGKISCEIDVFSKYMRSAGFDEGPVRNDDFISNGICSDIFKNRKG